MNAYLKEIADLCNIDKNLSWYDSRHTFATTVVLANDIPRNQIKTRSMEGIKIAQALGKFKGRKIGAIQSDEKLLEHHQVVQKKLKKGLTIRTISEITGASSATIIKVKKVMMNRNMIQAT